MSTSANKELLQRVFSELAEGDSRAFAAILAEDVRWTVIGTSKYSRTYDGKQSVLNELMAPVLSQVTEMVRVKPWRFIAEDDYVVVEWRGESVAKNGKVYNNTYCWVHRLADGQVREVTEYCDTALINDVFGD